MNEQQGIPFLCTGNSARSQMAEAFLHKYAGERFDGTEEEKLARFRETRDLIEKKIKAWLAEQSIAVQ